MSAPVQNPPTPHLQSIPGGFYPGCVLHVTGTYTPGAASLIVKLQTGPNGDPADEVGLCVYGRVREGQLGRNCFTRSAGWGGEEMTTSVQGLAPAMNFDLTVLCDPSHFKVAYNGIHLCEYVHRINPSSLSHVQVASLPGDLSLSCVWLEQPQQYMPQHQAAGVQYAGPPPPYASVSSAAPYSSSASLPYNPNPQSGYAAPPGMAQGQGYSQQQYSSYQQQGGSHQKDKGLVGMIGGAAAALGASGLLNKATKVLGGSGGGHHGGYPSAGGGGYPHGSNGRSNILSTAAKLAPAALLVAGPGKALKYGAPLAAASMLTNKHHGHSGGGGNKLLKYGAPLAAGYVVSKGIRKGFGGGGGGWSGSDSD